LWGFSVLGDNVKKKLTQNAANEIENFVLDALETDGAHHKQWYLEEIAKMLEIDLSNSEHDKGLAP